MKRNPSRRYGILGQEEPSPDASPSRQDEQMKEKLQDLSDIPPNPPNTAGRSQTLSRVEIIAMPAKASARRHHSWARGIGSSARLESVAHVENTVMDVYYRNDSMKSAWERLLEWLELVGWTVLLFEQYGLDLVLTKSRNEIKLDRRGKKLYTSSRTGCARMGLAGEGP